MGYEGKQIIHPNQIEPVQRAFTPTEDEIAHARRVMEAYQLHQQAGRGAFALDGKMVDLPIVKAAARVLARAAAAAGRSGLTAGFRRSETGALHPCTNHSSVTINRRNEQ